MVGPGEVDDELEGETQGECERFGPVRRCLIYEIKVSDTLFSFFSFWCVVLPRCPCVKFRLIRRSRSPRMQT